MGPDWQHNVRSVLGLRGCWVSQHVMNSWEDCREIETSSALHPVELAAAHVQHTRD